MYLFHAVIQKGQVMTRYYRVINKTGGFTWLQSCATLICSSPSTSAAAQAKAAAAATAAAANSPTSSLATNGPATEDQEQCIIMINYVIRWAIEGARS